MKTVKVLNGQTLLDLSVQYLGDVSRVMEIAELNDLFLTDDLQSGSMLKVPDADRTKRGVVNLFTNLANAPASAITDDDDNVGEGIGFWYLENDFVVQ